MSQRTPLFDHHVAAGARMVDFAGWEMPVQYSSILDEHKAVRENVGVFDISHMGEFFVSGLQAEAWLDSLLTNSVGKLKPGEAHYSLLLNQGGGVIDDLYVYRLKVDEFLLVVNASMISKDAAWMQSHERNGVIFQNCSSDYAALAVQGPLSPIVFEKLFNRPMPSERNRVIELGPPRAFVATTGYTGEAGFEWIIPNSEADAAWQAAIAAGAKPCGLGARDTLRLEMCYPLNGSDLSETHTPLEAGLGFFVDLKKSSFIGKDSLAEQQAAGVPARLAALKVIEKSPPIRPHYPVSIGGEQVTETTSGAISPSLGCGIALAYLPASLAKPGQEVEIEVRGRKFRACVIKKPFYQKKT